LKKHNKKYLQTIKDRLAETKTGQELTKVNISKNVSVPQNSVLLPKLDAWKKY